MQIIKFVFNSFGVNTYLVYDKSTGRCIVIDPGMSEEAEIKEFDDFVEERNLQIEKILLTHGHFDHIWGVNHAKNKYSVEVYSHKNDLFLIEDAASYASVYGLDFPGAVEVDNFLTGTDSIDFAGTKIEVLHTPGHSPGHLTFVFDEYEIVFTGDVLFKGSIGRTDLPGGDLDALMDSLWRKVLVLDERFTVFPGHGEKTTIGIEKNSNPFLLR